MNLRSVATDYVQKSRIFLYPMLGIKRGHSSTPINTYIAWEGRYALSDCKFICEYYIRDDEEFKNLERDKLAGNPLFDTFYQLEDDVGIYVFDFSDYVEDFLNFYKGRYSKLSSQTKRKILNFFKNHATHHVYIESYLYPKKYIPLYADLLSGESKDIPDMIKLLKEVGELCSKPDMSKECLVTKNFLENDIKIIDLYKTNKKEQDG